MGTRYSTSRCCVRPPESTSCGRKSSTPSMSWLTSTAPPPLPRRGRSSCGMRSLCSRRPGPVLPRPSLTSQPRTHRSSASTVATSLRSWSAWTLTGGGAASVGVLASSLGATSSQCTCDRSGVLGAEPADQPSTQQVRRKEQGHPLRGSHKAQWRALDWNVGLPTARPRLLTLHTNWERPPAPPNSSVRCPPGKGVPQASLDLLPLATSCVMSEVGQRLRPLQSQGDSRLLGSCSWRLNPGVGGLGGRVHHLQAYLPAL